MIYLLALGLVTESSMDYNFSLMISDHIPGQFDQTSPTVGQACIIVYIYVV